MGSHMPNLEGQYSNKENFEPVGFNSELTVKNWIDGSFNAKDWSVQVDTVQIKIQFYVVVAKTLKKKTYHSLSTMQIIKRRSW